MKKLLFLFSVLFLLTANLGNAQTLKIFRQIEGDKCIAGQISVNGTIICYTIEKPYIAENSEDLFFIAKNGL